jgi:hypothetical protein
LSNNASFCMETRMLDIAPPAVSANAEPAKTLAPFGW